ncbi:MAG: TIR domain-containing protein, partial [Lachnospiraceae bacterium]|nr:TIR domain-containing protein [Lachnospiraceae bacterium]
MERQYTYDAFISYRHTELDKYVAELLHKKLETFKTPKSIIKKNPACKKRIERVFRDKEELPLTNNLEDPIINAIKESEYLIVICSPRLKESRWCKREIETFIQCHGQQKVLAVLIEGEPHESFPDEILYVDEVVQYSDGTMGAIKKPVEPLAADLRGSSKKEIKKALDSEVLRLLAPMLGVTYDDLRQRHRERKLKKIITASVATASVCLAIGVASTLAALHINKQKNKIETQSIEIQAQAEEIQAQADEIQAQAEEIMLQNEKMAKEQAVNLAEEALDKLDDGDRIGAILTAKMALTEYEGITMPYTAEAKYALTESLHVYDAGEKIKAQYQVNSIGVIEDFIVSPDDVTVVSYDRTGSLIIWDSVNNQVMGCLTNGNSIYENGVSFIDNNRFAYITDEDAIAVHHVGSGSTEDAIVTDDSVYSVIADGSGNYIAITTRDTVQVYDATDYSLVCEHTVPEEYDLDNSLYFADSDTLIFYQ